MFFRLSDEQREIQHAVRDFAQHEIAPHAERWDEESYFPRELFRPLAEMGLAGLLVSEELGGTGLSRLTGAVIYEEIGKADMSTAVWLSVHNMVTGLIAKFGDDEQRQRWTPRMAGGEMLGAFALSEAHAGSDAANLRATATRDGDSYVLNGTKFWVTSAGVADVYVAFLRTSDDGARGTTAFIIEKDTPGFSIGKRERKMGLHSSPTGELIFERCRVPLANRLGAEGEGLKIALSSLDGGRINIGAIATGVAQAALDVSTRYAQERTAFGRAIGGFEGIQFMLADMAMKVEAGRLLVYQAAFKMDEGDPVGQYAAMAKCFATDSAMAVTTDAVQVLGGAGYVRDWPVERYMRDVKVAQIFEGTSQIQRLVIARALLGDAAKER
ncbi:MAG: Acyl-CoA dehydrogenase, short-chain specific [Ktedonobacterales bacterium]|jgi:alkylation response protein AidB-like acyl-CoA dehydrogenase|nr:MAG: Acyl-CoA dehydrogenase, short-chain specific [Ktedonobacterales bacterium]